ncbi:MAG: hypothetical protein APF80_14545 [Alphaproteobacteria bacterium BRH_c36]|nr:MAG: hypothetical protein APF80_14545 [Alphaproteobacteria bacterium BRH_c36]
MRHRLRKLSKLWPITEGRKVTIHHAPELKGDLNGLEDFLDLQRRRETRLRRALERIRSAAEGDNRFPPMNWTDVAEVARQALEETHKLTPRNG